MDAYVTITGFIKITVLEYKQNEGKDFILFAAGAKHST